MPGSLEFWSRFAPRYDGHVASRDAEVLAPRIAAAVGPAPRVLDAGCGTGQVTVRLARVAAHVDAMDFSPAMLAIAKGKVAGLGNVTFHAASVESLGLPEGAFDAVVLSNVLHLVDDPAKTLAEARRVLKPGGRLVAPTYCHSEGIRTAALSRLMGLLFGIPVRTRWTVEGFRALVRAAGFELSSGEVVRFKMPLVFAVAVPRGPVISCQ